jgi:hypothetical protein
MLIELFIFRVDSFNARFVVKLFCLSLSYSLAGIIIDEAVERSELVAKQEQLRIAINQREGVGF